MSATPSSNERRQASARAWSERLLRRVLEVRGRIDADRRRDAPAEQSPARPAASASRAEASSERTPPD
jgi:hypothetical protein